MNRTDEITATLEDAQTAAPGNTWADTYRNHVTYLLNALRSYGPPLQDKLREQSHVIAELQRTMAGLQRTVRRQRIALVGITAVAAIAVMVVASSLPTGRAGMSGPIAVAAADEQRPPVDRIAGIIHNAADSGGSFGWYCTEWEPAGTSCPGGCWWFRYCTPCIPGCDWYKDWECRPSSSGCPSLIVPEPPLSPEVLIE